MIFLTAVTWLEAHMGSCSFKEATGLVCPGCGLQRSIIALLQGHVLESITLFPALLPLIGMFGLLGIHLVFKLKHGAAILKILYITNAVLFVGHYIYQLITL